MTIAPDACAHLSVHGCTDDRCACVYLDVDDSSVNTMTVYDACIYLSVDDSSVLHDDSV